MKRELFPIFKSCCLLVLVISGLSSCINKETPIPAPPPGHDTVASVTMGETYKLQIYYNLYKNTIVSQNAFTVWDLGFETSADGWHVILNGAKFMKAYRTTKTSFESVVLSDTSGAYSNYDAASGNLDSTAIGDWRSTTPVYVLQRGIDETGKPLGICKFQILSGDATKFTVRFAAIDGSNDKTMDVTKNDLYNFSFLSFNNGGQQLLVEPPKTDWDIVFTKYTHIYYDLDNLPYSVTGCLLNRYQTSAGVDSLHTDFDAITAADAAQIPLSTAINVIGFDWKTYSGTYVVNSKKFFIIRNQQGVYFKLHFTDFYDKSGIKGTPTWEFQRL